MNNEEKLKEAKRLYQTANSDQKYVLESLFPELKENEDEKIRKAVIEMIHDTPNIECEENYNVRKEDVIAWLEKQEHIDENELGLNVSNPTSQNAQDLIKKYVSDHADCRWLDASELEQLLNDFVVEYDVIKNGEYEQQCKVSNDGNNR